MWRMPSEDRPRSTLRGRRRRAVSHIPAHSCCECKAGHRHDFLPFQRPRYHGGPGRPRHESQPSGWGRRPSRCRTPPVFRPARRVRRQPGIREGVRRGAGGFRSRGGLISAAAFRYGRAAILENLGACQPPRRSTWSRRAIAEAGLVAVLAKQRFQPEAARRWVTSPADTGDLENTADPRRVGRLTYSPGR